MSSVSSRREVAVLLIPAAILGVLALAQPREQPALRVCADANNLPFSDSSGRGFENRIASMIAADLGERLEYTWWPQRRGFIRNTLRTGACDVVMGLPSNYELAMLTRPYYRSSYVFVTRADRKLRIASLDDTILKRLRIGVHVMGDDYANSPAAIGLARRGLAANVEGYTIYGDYTKPHPASALIEAVARGDIDVAIAWGPLAGYFARGSNVPLALARVRPEVDLPFVPYVYDIAVGVRRGDTARRDALDRVLRDRGADVARILAAYGVPAIAAPRTTQVAQR